MSKADIGRVVSALPLMTSNELRVVQEAVKKLIGETEAPQKDETGGVAFEAFKAEFIQLGIRVDLSFQTFMKMPAYKVWKSKLPALEQFVEREFGKALTSRAKQVAMYRLLFNGLIASMRAMKIPITANTLTQQIDRIPETFEMSFPHYLECGLAFMVAKAVTGGR